MKIVIKKLSYKLEIEKKLNFRSSNNVVPPPYYYIEIFGYFIPLTVIFLCRYYKPIGI